MNRRSIIYYLVLFLIILSALFFYNYVYSIYEIKYQISNQIIFCNSTAEIKAVGINAMGYEITFRTIRAEYEIIEGQDLVEIIYKDVSKGELKIKALSKSGIVTIRATSQYSLLPAIIEIPIQVPFA
ncbi:MAG: hypothetical protein IPH11_15940 [Ignavibacteriales bacterium]|nr:hypothetical protein [Ignavibacteriales bacterium]